jgi:hypothetical protein
VAQLHAYQLHEIHPRAAAQYGELGRRTVCRDTKKRNHARPTHTRVEELTMAAWHTAAEFLQILGLDEFHRDGININDPWLAHGRREHVGDNLRITPLPQRPQPLIASSALSCHRLNKRLDISKGQRERSEFQAG